MSNAIEAAARALCGTPFPDTWEKLGADIQELYRREAEDALTAAAPFIQAAALRDAADEFRNCPDWGYRASRPMATEDYLRARANEIEATA